MSSFWQRLFGGISVRRQKPATRDEFKHIQIVLLPAGRVTPNSFYLRKHSQDLGIQSLADSIRTLGLISPIVVREMSFGAYEVVAGNRRLLACRQAGLEQIPAIVVSLSDREMLAISLAENIHRLDLNLMEEAEALERECNEFQTLTREDLARSLGMKIEEIEQRLNLLKLPPVVKKAISTGIISPQHAALLLNLAREDQIAAVEQIYQKNLSVPQAIKLLNLTKKKDASQ
ncbi:MAG: ParB/RepB/Spo0J family partition protein [Armatimonadetes bacterium]|nr:ParB/RepB/Spo0J family partition protein [Armatimonadota bacterium]